MSHLTPSTAPLQSAQSSGASSLESPSQCFPPSMQPMGNRSHHPFIHILDDDSLLIVFNFCRPVLMDEGENDDRRILQGGNWTRERWWYKLAQVCQRWRHLVLTSASYLDLRLVCTYGTPLTDMLAHSPPLPLIIDYLHHDHLYNHHGGEKDVVLALQHRNRARRIRLWIPFSVMKWLIAAIDGEFPVLEYLYLELPSESRFPETFQAPRLRHLVLSNTIISIGSPLLVRCVGLVTLSLQNINSSADSPNDLLQILSPMLHLETLRISLDTLITNWKIERQLLLTPVTTTVTLPNLRWFAFGGPNAYFEALLLHITSPLLQKFQILDLYPETFRVSCLLQFMSAAENLRFGSAKFRFDSKNVDVWVYPRKGARMYSFYMYFYSPYLSEQVLDTGRIFGALGTVFSAVEHLDLERQWSVESLRYPSLWRDLLGSFGGAKSLVVCRRLTGEISRSFRREDGESPMVFLPKLKEISYPTTGDDAGDAFIAFADAREKAGRPITLSRL